MAAVAQSAAACGAGNAWQARAFLTDSPFCRALPQTLPPSYVRFLDRHGGKAPHV